MLIGFTFQNFWSFYGENVFSMVASKDKEFFDFNIKKINQYELLKSAIMFGANASGKTSFVKAIEYMKAIIGSEPSAQSKFISGVNHFALAENANERPTILEVDFIYEDIIYQYGFEILKGEVNKEYLYDKTKRKTTVFERSSPDFKDIKFPNSVMNNVKDFAKNTRRDNLFLHWAVWGNNEHAMRVYKWFDNIKVFKTDVTSNLLKMTADYMKDNKDGNTKISELLQKADPTIVAFDINDNSLQVSRYRYDENKQITKLIRFLHDGYESAGTLKIFELSRAIIEALDNGNVVFIDEIDAKLHPMLVRFLVMMFNSIHQNPNNAQLICNTHDVLLLEEDFRRDQIYFTEKDEYGVSTLYSLSDFKGVRKEDKLLKRYLLDAYGATPKFTDTFSIKQKKATDNG